MAYLFVGQPAQSFKLLEHDIHNRPLNEYYHYRQVYAMVYFESGGLKVASHELENLQQSYRKRATQTKSYEPLQPCCLCLYKAKQHVPIKSAIKRANIKLSAPLKIWPGKK